MRIPMTTNVYGNSCVDWNHWSVRIRVRLYEPLFYLLPFKLWMWLDDNNLIISGDAEDCWVGGWELGPDD